MRLNSVDLPTLGRPIRAIMGSRPPSSVNSGATGPRAVWGGHGEGRYHRDFNEHNHSSCSAGLRYTVTMHHNQSDRAPHTLDWNEIDDVLLDMDGTLLDRHFDNFFFEEELPRRYAVKHALPFDEARDRLMRMYRSVEGELAWTDLHYWTEQVDIDVVAMHRELDHMIGFLPDAEEFLTSLRRLGKRVTILTNAHRAGVEVKAAKTGLDRRVDRIVDAFEVGWLKMRSEYWPTCRELVGFEPSRALYIDDDETMSRGGGAVWYRPHLSPFEVELAGVRNPFLAISPSKRFSRFCRGRAAPLFRLPVRMVTWPDQAVRAISSPVPWAGTAF